MICVSVFYVGGEGKHFDQAYYAEKHRALVFERAAHFGIFRYEIEQGVSGLVPGSAPMFVCIGRLYFKSVEGFAQAFAMHGVEIRGDVPNFTNIEPQFQIGNVV